MSHRFEKCFLALNKNSIIYLRTIRFRRMTVRFGDSRLIVTFPNKERVNYPVNRGSVIITFNLSHLTELKRTQVIEKLSENERYARAR